MNAKALGVLSGVALLALANGGFDGLLFVIALILASWVVRSACIGAAGAAERRRQAEKQREVERRRNEAQQREAQRKVERERQAERRREQAEQEREAERQRQRQREQASKQTEEGNWWAVLEVSPDASRDEIRRAYRGKIWRCHPDRVTWLVPERRTGHVGGLTSRKICADRPGDCGFPQVSGRLVGVGAASSEQVLKEIWQGELIATAWAPLRRQKPPKSKNCACAGASSQTLNPIAAAAARFLANP